MMDVHRQAFIEEAVELLAELEKSLLELEENPTDKEIIAKIFRALHTIKGSSGMFGYDEIAMFTHDIESVYDFIRNGEILVTKQIIDLTLKASDQISIMLFKDEKSVKLDETITKEILTSFRNILNDIKKKKSFEKDIVVEEKVNVVEKEIKPLKIYFIIFKPEKDIFLTGTNPISLIAELADLGEIFVRSVFDNNITLKDIDPEKCYFDWKILIKTNKGIDSIKDIFIFVEDQCLLNVIDCDKKNILTSPERFNAFGNYFIENVYNDKFDIENAIVNFESSINIEKRVIPEKNIKRSVLETHHEPDKVSSIRVSSEKLDELVNLVGELVTIQARLTQIAISSNDATMLTVSEEVERITWSLRDSALNIRMLPIGTTFSKFTRLVRDLSKELNKEINLTIEGAETELDKTVIEKLNDPLVHIIRNSIDHGIESPEIREKLGKKRVGEVHLSATQSGGNVLIKITDDGAGLDKEAIRQKAITSGIIAETAELSETELYSLIFAPGFSTAKRVTSVSGRGVGMDVVKRAIDALRGNIEVTSKKSIGTTITLKLPLTLAIIDGLLVKIANDNYVLPLSSVEECIELLQMDIDNVHGRHIVNIRGEIVPYLNLRERFGVVGARPEIEQVVIASYNSTRVGFVVDNVIGQHQTVLKTLGRLYKNIEGVSGATILGDGTVALILDIGKLVEQEVLFSKDLK
ncbi:MAG: chemotaxis protein CheA [bacterium]